MGPWPSAFGARLLVLGLVGLGGCASTSRATRAAAPSQSPPKSPGTRLFTDSAQTHCFQDAEIDPSEKAAVDQAALAFARALISTDASSPLGLMTREAQATFTSGATIQALGSQLMRGHVRDFEVAHTYVVEATGKGHNATAVCGLLKDHKWVAVAVKVGSRQAHATLRAHTLNDELAMSLWLLPEDGAWKVHLAHLGISSIAGRDLDALFALAQEERRAGHVFNAGVLYGMVGELLNRGPAFQLGIAQTISDDASTYVLPPELKGPPFVWRFGDTTYKVSSISPTGIQGKIGLIFVLPKETWPGEAQVDEANRRFLTAFLAAYPEVPHVFQFLVARAEKPDRSGGYATVYEVGNGFH